MKKILDRTIKTGLLVGMFISLSAVSHAEMLMTNTASVTSLSNDQSLGCTGCSRIVPLKGSDEEAANLPAMIRESLTPQNQFGAGVPAGSSDIPIVSSIPFGLVSGTFNIQFTNNFNSNINADATRSNNFNTRIIQTTPSGTKAGSTTQTFDSYFSGNSLTDTLGDLIGTATGTYNQLIKENTTTVVNNSGNFSYSEATGPVY